MRDEVIDLRDKLKKWLASYKRETTRRRWERQEEDVSTLIAPDKVKEFKQSQATQDAVILLGKLSGVHSMEITQAMYTHVRDYLIAQIMIDNGNRAGVVAFMIVKEFQRAKMEDDHYVVEVLHHRDRGHTWSLASGPYGTFVQLSWYFSEGTAHKASMFTSRRKHANVFVVAWKD